MALVPATTQFVIIPTAGNMDSRYPLGVQPPTGTARLVPIADITFTAGYAESEYLGYYCLDGNNLIDPSFVWWDTPGAVPQAIGGGNWLPNFVSSVSGTLPTGVSYDSATTRLYYDGSGTASVRELVTLTVGTDTVQFYVRVCVPNVIWGDATAGGGTNWANVLPDVYLTGALSSVPRRDSNSYSFRSTWTDYTSPGDTADVPAIGLVTRGTYEHAVEAERENVDIEWYGPPNRQFFILLGEPTRGHKPYFIRADKTRYVKFGLGANNVSSYDLTFKNFNSNWTYLTAQTPPETQAIPGNWRIRKCRFSDLEYSALGYFLDDVTGDSLSSGVRNPGTPKASEAQPWAYSIDLCEFDRCGTTPRPATFMRGTWWSNYSINGCRYLGAGGNTSIAVSSSARYTRIHNCEFSYIPDPLVVSTPKRINTAIELAGVAVADVFNVTALLGEHSGESVVRRFIARNKGTYLTDGVPIYPNFRAQAAPFTDLSFSFTVATVKTAATVQLKKNSGSWADSAGATAVLVSGDTHNVTIPHGELTSGRYKVRLRNAGSTVFSERPIHFHTYKTASYFLVSSAWDQGLDSTEYPEINDGPKAYEPDDGGAFWTSIDVNDGQDSRANKNFIAHCRITWDTRPLGASPAEGPNAVIYDEGSYPTESEAAGYYGLVPAEWIDASVWWIANNTFTGFGVVTPWETDQALQGSRDLFGVGEVPDPLPEPVMHDYLGSNTIQKLSELPDWWGEL
jgi:hypothetical protein